jgi:hypothetical protein
VSIRERLLSTTGLAVASGVLFVGVAIIAQVFLGPHNTLPDRPTTEALPLKSVGQTPVLQLELAWTEQQLSRILDPTNNPDARELNLAHVLSGNKIDSYAFVPTYGALLITLGALGYVAGGRRRDWLFPAIACGVVILVLADWLENIAILEVVRHLRNSLVHVAHCDPDLDAFDVSASAILKWSMLAVVAGLIGWQFFRTRTWWSRLLGLAAVALAAYIAYGVLAYARERIWSEPSSSTAILIERTPRG